MVARWWLLLLGLAADVLQVGGQRAPDTTGFISIDCGLSEQSSYVDDLTKLLLSSDAGFTDAGTNYDVSARSDAGFTDAGTNYDVSARYTNLLYRRFLTVRSFPSSVDGRSCYTLPSAVPGTSKYMVRAAFKYGDYDGLNKLPIFDLYLGVNLWRTVNITDAGLVQIAEAIVVIPEDRVQVCMVNIGSGTPFISTLDLRPLKNSLYPQANATQGLSMIFTGNFGASDVIRHYFTLYFAELHILNSSQARRFNVGYNNHLSMSNYEPSYLKLGYNNIEPVQFFNQYNVTISRAPNSTLPPIINACEFFSTMSTANVGTNAHDASAMIAIKAKYQVKKNWEGDPCSPKTLVWHGLNCSYPISLPPRITSV
uniref:Malectin-like domain-containing protein n=1 Tax=Aegilops tauschii TaxID=37682 RepID=M8B3S2_AEGTA